MVVTGEHPPVVQGSAPTRLPDGRIIPTWERDQRSRRTLVVDQRHPHADDGNPASSDRPFLTIAAAAAAAEPGDLVRVHAGTYREWVQPGRGGTGPDAMIRYEAAPGERVVVTGAEPVEGPWRAAAVWPGWPTATSDRPARVWVTELDPATFRGAHPFAVTRYRQGPQISYWNLAKLYGNPLAPALLRTSGLLFQDGQPVDQVDAYLDLVDRDGTFWVDPGGATLHVRPFGDVEPATVAWEATARQQVFAPVESNLGWIAVRGFTLTHAGGIFPFPQRGALSTTLGHHWLIEGNEIRWANGVAVDIGNQGGEFPPREPELLGRHIVRGNIIEDIGICGLAGPAADASLVEDNLFRRTAFHDVEFAAESAAIKLHHVRDTVIRRNLVLDTTHGAGIYIDYLNGNSRVTRNVIVDTDTSNWIGGHGGIYVEHALEPVWVDHNVIWGSPRANGIYANQTTKLTIAHNLIGDCAGAAICVLDMPGRGSIPGGNRLVGNTSIGNGRHVGFFTSDNASDGNVLDVDHPDAFRLGLSPAEYRPHIGAMRKRGRRARKMSLAEWQGRGQDRRSSVGAVAATLDRDALTITWEQPGRTRPVETEVDCPGVDWTVACPTVESRRPGSFDALDPRHAIGDDRT